MTSPNDLFADIWGSLEKQPQASGSKASPLATRTGPKLFHSDDELSDTGRASRKATTTKGAVELPPDLDALFPADDDVDGGDDFNFGSTTDLAQLTKEAEARHAKALSPVRKQQSAQTAKEKKSSSGNAVDPLEMELSDGGNAPANMLPSKSTAKDDDLPKKRKPIPKLDEARLLGDYGFRALIPSAKKFKPKGKGHEASDLARVLEMYQLWSHRMYPKMQFRDSIDRVEKLCHSRRMMTSLSVWKDEDKNGPLASRSGQEPIRDVSDGEDDDAGVYIKDVDASGRTIPRAGAAASSPDPPRNSNTTDIDDAELDALMANMSKTQTESQPSDFPDDGDYPDEADDEDLWALAEEMQEGGLSEKPPPKKLNPVGADEEADMWASMGDAVTDDFMDVMQESSHKLNETANEEPPTDTANKITNEQRSSSPTVGSGLGEETSTTMDVDVSGEPQNKTRRQSIREEFDEGWDDMYE